MEFFILLLFVLWGIGFFAFRKARKESRNAHQLFMSIGFQI
jgi:cbb3-type cytochrome oxidase subunit 3